MLPKWHLLQMAGAIFVQNMKKTETTGAAAQNGVK